MSAPVERVRMLLLRGDNVLKSQGRADDPAARVARARAAFEEAREAALDPSVPDALRELVARRLAALGAPGGSGDAQPG